MPAAGNPRPGFEPDRIDIPARLTDLTERLSVAQHYLGIDHLRSRRTELEAAASRPDLWDDPDNARSVTTELGRVTEDLELSEEEDDQSQRPEVEAGLADLDRRLGALELRSLFSGDHDELDAVAEIHA